MAKRRKNDPPGWKKLTKKELRAAYDKIKKEFSAADLQKYTVEEDRQASQAEEGLTWARGEPKSKNPIAFPSHVA
jgi:hypothetical protein